MMTEAQAGVTCLGMARGATRQGRQVVSRRCKRRANGRSLKASGTPTPCPLSNDQLPVA